MNSPVDLSAARAFVTTHGRLLDRRRLALFLGGGNESAVLTALQGYRNFDGGYGWGLEPDLRSPESQPCAAMHALEVLAEIAPLTSPPSVELCDWLDAITLPDGGLPFACSITDEAGCAPWWRNPNTSASSLQITAQVAANAHVVAHHDPAVRHHPWLARATRWCLAAIATLDTKPFAIELLFAMRFLDAIADDEPEAILLLERLAEYIPADGIVSVDGGAEGEELRALDFARRPDGPLATLFEKRIVAAELDRLAKAQEPDGGWTVTFVSASPAASLEWRAYATIDALMRLRAHRVLQWPTF